MAKVTPTQRAVLECDAIEGSSFAMTTTWWMGAEKVTPTVKALIAKDYMRRVKVGVDNYRAVITDAGRAALGA